MLIVRMAMRMHWSKKNEKRKKKKIEGIEVWMRTVWYWCQISVVKNNIFQRVNTSVCEYYLYSRTYYNLFP